MIYNCRASYLSLPEHQRSWKQCFKKIAASLVKESVKVVAAAYFLYALTIPLVKGKGNQELPYSARVVVLGAPLIEEIFFRGIVLQGILLMQMIWNSCIRKQLPTEKETRIQQIIRIQLCGLTFAIVHINNPVPKKMLIPLLLSCYVFGCTYGYLCEKYQTIAVPIIFHGLHNFAIVARKIYPESLPIFLVLGIIVDIGALFLAFKGEVTVNFKRREKNEIPLQSNQNDRV